MESLRKLIALAGFIACLTVSVKAQDFNKQLRKAILKNGYAPVIPALAGPSPSQLIALHRTVIASPLALIGVLIYVG